MLLAVGIGCLQYVLERGESEEWFSSETIRYCSGIALVTLANCEESLRSFVFPREGFA